MGVCTVDGVKLESGLTTPSLIFIRKVLYQYQDEVDVVFIEASSHGLHQGRLFWSSVRLRSMDELYPRPS